MADTILTIRQLEDIFQRITTEILGLDPNDTANASKVRIAWPTCGAPAWKITDDVVFIRVNNADDPITRQRDVEYSSIDADTANKKVHYTRVHSIKWILYGPNSFDNAETVRNGLYLPQFKEGLAKNNLYLITDVPAPVRIPELFNGQWWERTDLTAAFNGMVVRITTVPYIKSADVIIKKG